MPTPLHNIRQLGGDALDDCNGPEMTSWQGHIASGGECRRTLKRACATPARGRGSSR